MLWRGTAQGLFALLVVGGLLLVGNASRAPDVETVYPVDPSPLPAFDPDRLWRLVQEGKLQPITACRDYYRSPIAAVRRSVRRSCQDWEKRALVFLRANGLPSLEREHLAEPFFIDWYDAKAREIEERSADR